MSQYRHLMQENPKDPPAAEKQEAAPTEAAPKKEPHKAAQSLNPKERSHFYEAVVPKSSKRTRK